MTKDEKPLIIQIKSGLQCLDLKESNKRLLPMQKTWNVG
jgi:hypothetical protein